MEKFDSTMLKKWRQVNHRFLCFINEVEADCDTAIVKIDNIMKKMLDSERLCYQIKQRIYSGFHDDAKREIILKKILSRKTIELKKINKNLVFGSVVRRESAIRHEKEDISEYEQYSSYVQVVSIYVCYEVPI